MDLYDFFNTFVTALAQDPDLDVWARVHFDRGVSVFADIQSEAPPSVDDMPYILMERPGAERDQADPVQRHVMELTLALNKDALTVRAEPLLEEPAGIELIMDMVTKTVSAVKGGMPANTEMGYNLTSDTIGSLPAVYAYMTLEFRTLTTIGEDPLE